MIGLGLVFTSILAVNADIPDPTAPSSGDVPPFSDDCRKAFAIAISSAPANQGAVPAAAANGGGWKGVAACRASDGVFVSTKARTGSSGYSWRTVTFTQSELAMLDQNAAYTVGVNDSPSADPDGDGIPNLMEFALGGAPLAPSGRILPVLAKTVGNWTFDYDRSDLSQASTTQVVEYDSTVTG